MKHRAHVNDIQTKYDELTYARDAITDESTTGDYAEIDYLKTAFYDFLGHLHLTYDDAVGVLAYTRALR
jgi:hypothetical protein